MNCQNFETLVNDLVREQMMDANLRKEALTHSGACEQCATRLADERALTFGLRALDAQTKALAVPKRIEVELLAAFRERQSATRDSRSHWRYFAAAAAAVIMIVSGMALMRVRQGTRDEALTVKTAPPVELTVPLRGPITETAVSAVNSNRIRLTNHHQQTTSVRKMIAGAREQKDRNAAKSSANVTTGLADGEVASAFVPLGYMNPASLQDGGQVVRVELTRSAMVSLGFAVNMDRYGERVKADVLVGNDGLARAIRFVQ